MKKIILGFTMLQTLALYSAAFEATLKQGSASVFTDTEIWKGASDSKPGYPGFADDVKILPHQYTENYSLRLDFPDLAAQDPIGFKSLSLDVENSLGIIIMPKDSPFSIAGDFVKISQTELKDGKLRAKGNHAAVSIASYFGDSTTIFSVKGNMRLIDKAINRTSSMFFGAYTTTGEFRGRSFFDKFEIGGDLELINQKFAVATRDGRNAIIKGQVKFDSTASGRTGILALNHDYRPEAGNLEQTVKVGGLESLSSGAGIVTTRTGMQRLVDLKVGEVQNPKDPIGKVLVGDEVVRVGVLEIVGKGGNFSGEIRDNLNADDKRGKVGLIMNSLNGKQVLSGKITYTGETLIKAGELILNGAYPIGNLKLIGGNVGFTSETLTVKDLSWSSGGFSIDFAKNRGIVIEGDINTSVIPEALDTFVFSNITPRKAYTILSFENKKNALSAFSGKKIEYTDAATGKVYEAIFGISDVAFTIVFMPK